MKAAPLRAPFPWFGGKSQVASMVWERFGDVSHYVEPFFGSGAVLLQRPHAPRLETVNDADGLLANFWRAVKHDPAAVADAADWPCNEVDLHARHAWLVGARERLTERLMGDPDFYDVRAAGWWVWGACNWIGRGWCTGDGPWLAVDGRLVDSRQIPHLTGAQGVNLQLPRLTEGRGMNRQLPRLTEGQGVNRKQFIIDWFTALSDRLREVRVACGDWSRIVGTLTLAAGGGVTGIFLDPPYDEGEHAIKYAAGTGTVASDVRAWALANGDDPKLRIALCGYAGEHDELEEAGWSVVRWKARGGYGSQGKGRARENAARETIWFSPHCLGTQELTLFDMEAT